MKRRLSQSETESYLLKIISEEAKPKTFRYKHYEIRVLTNTTEVKK